MSTPRQVESLTAIVGRGSFTAAGDPRHAGTLRDGVLAGRADLAFRPLSVEWPNPR
ncbi:hypothetical protein [Actinosynnema sp. NPDC020468]|uniref:hypothetical protein n=1 Tax=Actinosynnema sp. NPDC020468 TaxID=3154488 RepID=UPI0033CB15DB